MIAIKKVMIADNTGQKQPKNSRAAVSLISRLSRLSSTRRCGQRRLYRAKLRFISNQTSLNIYPQRHLNILTK